MHSNPIICALDTRDIEHAKRLAQRLRGKVGMFKLGLEFVGAFGSEGVKTLGRQGTPIFLDLKLHDIPTTVSRAITAWMAATDVAMITIHSTGGRAMMEAAAEAAEKGSKTYSKQKPLLLGVTMLTSMDARDMVDIGITRSLEVQVAELAGLAMRCGLGGVICSPLEIAPLRSRFGKELKLVVPGIRLEGEKQHDQKRVMTPKEAMAKGADYLVIGRPITEAQDPTAAAEHILASL